MIDDFMIDDFMIDASLFVCMYSKVTYGSGSYWGPGLSSNWIEIKFFPRMISFLLPGYRETGFRGDFWVTGPRIYPEPRPGS